ncbi:MAG: gluconolaconase [Sphingobacteriales bacterium]|nr:MAG: gluconolaconase [Sphingobacteriales bacterium]
MKNILWCFLLAGCAAAIPDQPTTRIEFMAPESYPEGIAFDSLSNMYYVSSARLGTVGKVTPEGVYSLLYSDSNPRSTYGVKVHPDGKRIFVCVSDANYSKFTSAATRKKLARLISIDKATGKKIDDIDLSQAAPGEHFANDIAFDTSGNIYVTDSFANVIYKVSKDGNVSVFADSPMFKTKGVGLNGIVYHPGGYLLTVSSGTGAIYKIEIANPKNVQKVKTDQFFMNGDGLLLDGLELVLVQNGGSDKIYRLSSGDNWQSAKLAATTSLNDRFTYPSTATKAGDKVWVMNAKFPELVDSTSVPSQKFTIQHARFVPVP